jgi:hypothetical protein
MSHFMACWVCTLTAARWCGSADDRDDAAAVVTARSGTGDVIIDDLR